MEMKDIEQLLNGVVYERDAVSRVFEELDIRPYFGTITKGRSGRLHYGEMTEYKTHGSETMEQVSLYINGKKTQVSIEKLDPAICAAGGFGIDRRKVRMQHRRLRGLQSYH